MLIFLIIILNRIKSKGLILLLLVFTSCNNRNKQAYSGYWCNIEAYTYAKSEIGKNDELIQFYNAEVDGIIYQVLPNSIRISYEKKEVYAPGAKLKILKFDNQKIYVQTENGYNGILLITPIKRNVIKISLMEADNNFFEEQAWFSFDEKDVLHRCDILK